MSIEQNLRASFREVKLDIISVKDQLLSLAEEQRDLRDLILNMEKKSSGKKKVIKKKVEIKAVPKTKHKTTSFVAAKEGKKFHIKACPFAKNIKPKSKVSFKSKISALNQGYKPCECARKL
jgi:hypothetical protein